MSSSTVRAIIKKIQNYHEPAGERTQGSFVSSLSEMIREVRKISTNHSFRITQFGSILGSSNPPYDVISMPTTCLEGIPERSLSYLLVTSKSAGEFVGRRNFNCDRVLWSDETHLALCRNKNGDKEST